MWIKWIWLINVNQWKMAQHLQRFIIIYYVYWNINPQNNLLKKLFKKKLNIQKPKCVGCECKERWNHHRFLLKTENTVYQHFTNAMWCHSRHSTYVVHTRPIIPLKICRFVLRKVAYAKIVFKIYFFVAKCPTGEE